jgi:hypothetical protein
METVRKENGGGKFMGANDSIELRFLHPRQSSMSLTAQVSRQCSGEEALRGLMDDSGDGAFLSRLKPGQTYELTLHRTATPITPHMSFEQVGAIDGDWIDVRVSATGGGPGSSELGHMLFWSAAAASIFLKSAAPIIVEFLRSRSSRSITIQRGEKKIIITGAAAEKVKDVWTLLENPREANSDQREGMPSRGGVTIDDRSKDAGANDLLEQSDQLNPPISVTLSDSESVDTREE